jgi:hypothetical protein
VTGGRIENAAFVELQGLVGVAIASEEESLQAIERGFVDAELGADHPFQLVSHFLILGEPSLEFLARVTTHDLDRRSRKPDQILTLAAR